LERTLVISGAQARSISYLQHNQLPQAIHSALSWGFEMAKKYVDDPFSIPMPLPEPTLMNPYQDAALKLKK
jgi:hypothetical protein